jgi:hypothetical protein
MTAYNKIMRRIGLVIVRGEGYFGLTIHVQYFGSSFVVTRK